MKKITTSFAIGAALLSGVASADSNLFGATELSSGYMQLAEAEMKCGADMKMDAPAAKISEAVCAAKKVDATKATVTNAAESKATGAINSVTPTVPAVPSIPAIKP